MDVLYTFYKNRIGKITLNWEIIFSKLELGDAKFGFGRWEMGEKRLGDGKFQPYVMVPPKA